MSWKYPARAAFSSAAPSKHLAAAQAAQASSTAKATRSFKHLLVLIACCACAGWGAPGVAAPAANGVLYGNAHAAEGASPTPVANTVFLSAERLAAIKAEVEAGREPWTSAYEQLLRDAERALGQRPRSVTDNGGPVGGGRDRHKFGTDHPTAPRADRSDYGAATKMGNWVRDLGMAYAFTGDDRYARKAVDLLYHWAVNPSTRMEPLTKNFSPHRHTDSKKKQNSIEIYISLPQMFYGASFVMGHPQWAEKGRSAKEDFLGWAKAIAQHTDSYYKGQHNNIYAWRTVLQAAAASIAGDRALMQRAFDKWKETAIGQIDAEGKLYHELKRTNSLGYSLYALQALTLTAEIASLHGVDLYSYRDGKGGSALRRALDYHAPYVVNPAAWPHPSVAPRSQAGPAAIYELAYSHWQDGDYMKVVSRHGRPLKGNRVSGWTTLTHGNLFKLEPKPEPVLAVAITSPGPAAVFAAPADVTIEADVQGDGATVAFFANGTKVGERTSAPYRLVWSGVAAGSYALTAKVADRRGNVATVAGPTDIVVAGRAGGGITNGAGIKVRHVRARSAQAPNVAARAHDGDLATRWSAEGAGQWLRLDLDGRYEVDALDVAWYKGDRRRAHFAIEVSLDGRSWRRVYRGASSGTTARPERVTFAAREARHVRLVGEGNTANDWNSVTEVQVMGRPVIGPVAVKGIRARSAQAPNVAANVHDGDLATRWSAEGAGQWLQLDLDGPHRVSAVEVAWYKGDQRRARFDVEVSFDGARWTRVYRGSSSGAGAGLERVAFAAVEARHVRLVGRGNTANDWNSVTEVQVMGVAALSASKTAGASPPVAPGADRRTSEPFGASAFELGQNFPNPLASTTAIAYRLPEAAQVTLAVYDVAGRRVRTLVRERQAAGPHEVEWDGCDGAGRPLPSGLYLYRIEAGARQQARTLTLLR